MCTQAWCKFHEVLGTYPSIAELSAARELNTVHLCEAPGAFIASLNHFLVCRGLVSLLTVFVGIRLSSEYFYTDTVIMTTFSALTLLVG